jgi:hypothetical protein
MEHQRMVSDRNAVMLLRMHRIIEAARRSVEVDAITFYDDEAY